MTHPRTQHHATAPPTRQPRPRRGRGRGAWRGEDGYAGVSTLFIISALIALLGLGGTYLLGVSDKIAAYDLAQSAARAGAARLDLTQLRTTGRVRLDPVAAHTAAHQHLRAAGVTGAVSATHSRVTVVVQMPMNPVLATLVDTRDPYLRARAHAQPHLPPP